MPIKFWRIPFHCYQSGGGSRFYRYFDDVTIFLGILHLSENLLLRLSHCVIPVYTEFFSFLAFSESFLKFFRVFLVSHSTFIMYL